MNSISVEDISYRKYLPVLGTSRAYFDMDRTKAASGIGVHST